MTGGIKLTKIQEIQNRLNRTMPHPWSYKEEVYGSTKILDATGEPVYFVDSSGDIEIFPDEAKFISNAPSDVEYLLQTIEKMKKALEFYSNEANYSSEEGVSVSKVDEDYGAIAEEVLNSIK